MKPLSQIQRKAHGSENDVIKGRAFCSYFIEWTGSMRRGDVEFP